MASKAFVRFPKDALDDEALGSAEVRVLLAIASFANAKSGRAFPSHKKIARRARCSRQTVIRSVGILTRRGWLGVHNRTRPNGSQTTNGYVLLSGPSPITKQATPVEVPQLGPVGTANATPGGARDETPNYKQDLSNNYGCHVAHFGDPIETSAPPDYSIDSRYGGPQMPLTTEEHRELRRLERELLGEATDRALFVALRRDDRAVIAPDASHLRRVYLEFAPLLRAEGALEIIESHTNQRRWLWPPPELARREDAA